MEEKRLFFKCLAGKLEIFLLLWGAAMAALVWVNYRWCQEDIVQQYSDPPMRIRTGEVTFTAQPKGLGIVRILPWEDGYCSAQLTMMGDGLLRDYGGSSFSGATRKTATGWARRRCLKRWNPEWLSGSGVLPVGHR